MSVASLRLRPVYTRRKNLQYSSNRRLVGCKDSLEVLGEEKLVDNKLGGKKLEGKE
jgi:hypothetical protein